jgi:hypothetical protein
MEQILKTKISRSKYWGTQKLGINPTRALRRTAYGTRLEYALCSEAIRVAQRDIEGARSTAPPAY